jgi:DNA primase
LIPRTFIDDLLNRVDIVDVISKSVTLKKSGSNLQGLCPFHQEKSPSFSVSETKQFYHCFGCGAHGSAINFLMEYAGLSFVDAIEDLASTIGLSVPKEASSAVGMAIQEQAVALTEVMQKATRKFKEKSKSNSVFEKSRTFWRHCKALWYWICQ